MRRDMKRVIVNTSRIKTSVNYRILRKKENHAVRRNPDSLPFKLGIRRPYLFDHRKEFGDRTKPLQRFLRSNVGRPWNDVYSEICAHADPRSISGYHLRSHVFDDIIDLRRPDRSLLWGEDENLEGTAIRALSYRDLFYINLDGILCFRPRKRFSLRRTVKEDEKKYNPEHHILVLYNGNRYIRRGGLWYRIDLQTRVHRYIHPISKELITFTHTYEADVQIGKKELRLVKRIAKEKMRDACN